MLREGIEDYEFLVRLSELLEKRRDGLPATRLRRIESLLQTPDSITKSMTSFTTDSTPIYTRRKAIAEAIERLAH